MVDLTAEFIQSRNIRYLALDFDGVLANHGEVKPLAEAEAWLSQFIQVIPQSHIALLSNKPFTERVVYFQQRFPNIIIISGVLKKPYPEGLNKLVAHFNCAKHELALVDDRLLTGMLAVCIAGVQGVYIEKPYSNYKKRLIAECFFSVIRQAERAWVGWLGKNARTNQSNPS